MKKILLTLLLIPIRTSYCAYEAYNTSQIKKPALINAAIEGLSGKIRFLVANGYNKICIKDEQGNTPLMVATVNKNYSAMETFIDIDKNCIDIKNNIGSCPLMIAIQQEDRISFEILLDSGANVNQVNENNDSLLAIAIRMKSLDLINILIDCKADCLILNKDNESALDIALATKNSDIINAIENIHYERICSLLRPYFKKCKNSQDISNLVESLAKLKKTSFLFKNKIMRETIIKFISDLFFNENLIDLTLLYYKTNDNTMIKLTSEFIPLKTGNFEAIIKKLFDKDSLLHVIDMNCFNTAKFLIKNGEDLEQINSLCETPLFAAITKNNEELVKILISKNANINHINKEGVNTLFVAVVNNNVNIARALLETKRAQGLIGGTLIAWILLVSKNPDMMKLMIEFNANIGDIVINKNTVLMEAIKLTAWEIVKLLLSSNVILNVTLTNIENKNALNLLLEKKIEHKNDVKLTQELEAITKLLRSKILSESKYFKNLAKVNYINLKR